MAALGTGESAVDSGAPSRGDALDTGGLLPAALAFVPVTLGTGASLFGFFLQGEVFRHGHFFILPNRRIKKPRWRNLVVSVRD